MRRVDALFERQTEARRRRANAAARRAVEALRPLGVEARVVGSLARGTFRRHSDIDLLIVECPREWVYRLESVVEDAVEGFPFDVIYADQAAEAFRAELLEEARHASDRP